MSHYGLEVNKVDIDSLTFLSYFFSSTTFVHDLNVTRVSDQIFVIYVQVNMFHFSFNMSTIVRVKAYQIYLC